MNTTVMIQIRNVYGQLKAYPSNVTATKFANLLGTSTLTRAALEKIEGLGFCVVVASPDTNWREVQ